MPKLSPAQIYTVSQLNRDVRTLIESEIGVITLEAELSNFSQPRSGHWYFSLKDDHSQVRAAMFRNANRHVQTQPFDGQAVLVRARVGLYEPRGDYQLIVESLEDLGTGQLQRAFIALRDRLAAEGLFDNQHKRPLPQEIHRIGIVTSATGAALQDVLQVLGRRHPTAEIIVYPTVVQGQGAGMEIARMLAQADQRAEVDVLLLVRGGGSMEDLWAFNDEMLAHAIHASVLPIVSGVGHEVDITIADLVADLRAPTPSAAAELVSPDHRLQLQQLDDLQRRAQAALQRSIQQHTLKLTTLAQRHANQAPKRQLEQDMQRLDLLEQRLLHAQSQRQAQSDARCTQLARRLHACHPQPFISQSQRHIDHLTEQLQRAIGHQISAHTGKLAELGRSLNAVSPLNTLARGYAIVSDEHGTTLKDPADIAVGSTLQVRLQKGTLSAQVTKTPKG